MVPSIINPVPDRPPWYKRLRNRLRRVTVAPESLRDEHLRLQFVFAFLALAFAVGLVELFFDEWSKWRKLTLHALTFITFFFVLVRGLCAAANWAVERAEQPLVSITSRNPAATVRVDSYSSNCA